MALVNRYYQDETIDAGYQFLTAKKYNGAGLGILPTGTGKSIVIAGLVKKLNDRTLILQPNKEILKQNFKKYRDYGFYASVYSASLKSKEVSNTVFAMIGSIVNKPHLFYNFKYILIDEAHLVNPENKTMYGKFLEALPQCRVMGFTATAFRLSSDGFGGSIMKFLTRTRPRIFKHVVKVVQTRPMFDEGFLCPLRYFVVGKFDRSKIRLNSTGADFDERSLQEYYKKIDLGGNIIQVSNKLAQNRKNVLIFVRYIKEAAHLMKYVPGSEMVTSEMKPAERDAILERFRNGITKILINIGIVEIGFDFPALETILVGRETMSLAKWYQWLGRGTRPHPDKASCWIVDMGDNYRMFGKIEDLHIEDSGNGKWVVTSNGKALTNEYYGEVYNAGQKN